MTRECHVRFCESLEGWFLWATRLVLHVMPPMYLLSSFNLGGEVYKTDVDTDRSLLYVATGSSGVVIQNVSDPYNTYTVAQYDDIDGFVDIVSLALSPDKTKLYAIDSIQGRIIALDVSEPTAYNYLGEVAFENGSDLVVSPDGKHLYVIGYGILGIFDASNLSMLADYSINADNIAFENEKLVTVYETECDEITYYDKPTL